MKRAHVNKNRPINLTTCIDRSCWFAHNRIAVLLSNRARGIAQIDYHGLQPVSRNARMLMHDQGVLHFIFRYRHKGREISLPLIPGAISATASEITYRCTGPGVCVFLSLRTIDQRLKVRCAYEQRSGSQISDTVFQILWNTESMTTDVHGEREWEKPQLSHSFVHCQVRDHISLYKWIRKSGDYQGDFLIPESWRRILFKVRKKSGLCGYADLYDAYREKDLCLYDTITRMWAGGSDFRAGYQDEHTIRFESSSFHPDKDASHALVFCLGFEHGDREILHPKPGAVERPVHETVQSMEKPELSLPPFPAIEDFFAQVPDIAASATVKDYGLTRACLGSYYWIWAWDNMVTGYAMPLWGGADQVERMSGFLRRHRDLDGSIPMRWTRRLEPLDSCGFGALDFLYSELLLTLYSEKPDLSPLRAAYPYVKHAFDTLSGKLDEDGLFPSMGFYPDLPEKMGRSAESRVMIDAGAWYGLCRNVEKLALLLDDHRSAKLALDFSAQARQTIDRHFWNSETGFYRDHFTPNRKENADSFPLYSILFLESVFGYDLVRDHLQECASFIENHLFTKNGVLMSPVWDPNHTSEVALTSWYPHWDLVAMRILVRAKKNHTILRWLEMVSACLTEMGYCPEFLRIDDTEHVDYTQHGAVWNLNCTAGWYLACLLAVFGLDIDSGGMTFYACDTVRNATVKNLIFRRARWTITKSGSGTHIDELRIDGDSIKGSYKIPRGYYSGGIHQVEIRQSTVPPPYPQLAALWGGELIDSQVEATQTTCRFFGIGQVDIHVSCRQRPNIYLDGKEISAQWHQDLETTFARVQCLGTHELVIK